MAIDLSDVDILDYEDSLASLTDELDWRDLQESQDCLITVQYNEIDLGRTPYHFNQPFVGNEANLYFQRMKEFSGLSVNYIVEHSDFKSHFYRTVFEQFHFELGLELSNYSFLDINLRKSGHKSLVKKKILAKILNKIYVQERGGRHEQMAFTAVIWMMSQRGGCRWWP